MLPLRSPVHFFTSLCRRCYQYAYGLLAARVPDTHVVVNILIATHPSVQLDRIKLRGRLEEAKIDLAFCTTLEGHYMQLYTGVYGVESPSTTLCAPPFPLDLSFFVHSTFLLHACILPDLTPGRRLYIEVS